jgi:uncharacterized phage protein (TIGR01671 family)
MNREIKFRGQCTPDSKYAGKWVEGSLVVCDDGCALIVCALNDHNTMTYHVKPDTVGQFTGLKDCNVKEIYEGDIIESKFGIRQLIKYDDDSATFLAYKLPLNEFDNGCHIENNWVVNFEKKVIGNVFNNPELLKKEEI